MSNAEVPQPGTREAAVAALKFVYPGIIVTDKQVGPDLAALAFLLVRALDSTSTATYGAFLLYEVMFKGLAKGGLRWSDISSAVVKGVKAGLADQEGRRNSVAQAALHYKFPLRTIQAHINNPETFPLPTVSIDQSSILDRWVFRL